MTLTELGHMTIELSHLTTQLGQKHLKNFSLMQIVVYVPNYFFSEKKSPSHSSACQSRPLKPNYGPVND